MTMHKKAPRGDLGRGTGQGVLDAPSYVYDSTKSPPCQVGNGDGLAHILRLRDHALMLARRSRQRQLVGLPTVDPARHEAIQRSLERLALDRLDVTWEAPKC